MKIINLIFGNLDYEYYISCKYSNGLVTNNDILLTDLNLSYRSINWLSKSGFKTVFQLLNSSEFDLYKIKNLGSKSILEIFNAIRHSVIINKLTLAEKRAINYVKLNYDNQLNNFEFLKDKIAFSLSISDLFEYDKSIGPIESIDSLLGNNQKWFNFLKNFLYKKIKEANGCITKTKILDIFRISNEKYLIHIDSFLERLINSDYLFEFNNSYYLPNNSIIDYMYSLNDNFEKKALTLRLEKKLTLQEIANKLWVSKERARQIIAKLISKIPLVKEDLYKDIFSKYNFDSECFCYVFNLPSVSFNFLKNKYKRGSESIFELLNDELISVEIKKRLKNFLKKDYLFLENGNIVAKKRYDIVAYLIKNYCYEDTNINEFYQRYLNFLKEHNLNNQIPTYEKRVFENKLLSSPNILWKFKKVFRYFDIDSFDMDQFLTEIKFDQYDNLEISTNLFFIKHPDIMEKYDIRNEYELHNILRKKIENGYTYKKLKINPLRTPNISIGNSDRNNQVLSLLQQNSPIKMEKLAMIYRESFGVKIKSFIANYIDHISKYLSNGIYVIDLLEMSDEEITYMKSNLTDDIYSVDEFKKTFFNKFSNANVEKINYLNFKKIGFKITLGILVRSYCKSLNECIRNIIQSREILDLNLDYKYLLTHSCFSAIKKNITYNFDFVEIDKNKFIPFRKLSEKGISKIDIYNFIDQIQKFSNDNFFNYEIALKKGFNHKLNYLDCDNYFYESLLKTSNELKYIKFNNTLLFKKTNKNFSFMDFVLDSFAIYKSKKYSDFLNTLKQEYLLDIDIYKTEKILRYKLMLSDDFFKS